MEPPVTDASSTQNTTTSSGSSTDPKSKPTETVVIKKYANRRLYNTASSSYVTLDTLAEMVRQGIDFVVFDARTNEDITRSVLAQIIFDEESRGQNLLPIQFLRQLIRFYGDGVQGLLPTYLEMSLDAFTRQQEQFRDQFKTAFGANTGIGLIDEQVRQNLALFDRAMKMWSPFGFPGTGFAPHQGGGSKSAQADAAPTGPADKSTDLSELKHQLDEMRAQIAKLSRKE